VSYGYLVKLDNGNYLWQSLTMASVQSSRIVRKKQTIVAKAAWAVLRTMTAYAVLTLPILWHTTPLNAQEDSVWRIGRFSFSDELGGFTITGVSGTGTLRNPYYIRQIFNTADSGTMVIRTHQMDNVASLPNNNITHSAIHVQIETVNNSNLSWIGFGFELQEVLGTVSNYGDGLSFDQLARKKADISSDTFTRFEEQFEPGDRLVYVGGVVDNQKKVTTKFIITDFTPVEEFYLYQDPQIPAS